MLALPRNPRLVTFLGLFVLFFGALLFYNRARIETTVTSRVKGLKGSYGGEELQGVANATLGFGGLFVVSGPGSARREHLLQAAAVTELNLTIPEQKVWTDEDIRNFRTEPEEDSKVGLGSVKAWLSHHLVLKAFLESGVETALIFEDDVDWDIRLRTIQIPLAQQALRQLAKSWNLSLEKHPWGKMKDWDVLYLGHCGDYFNGIPEGVGVGHHHPEDLEEIDHIIFEDPTLQHRTNVHPFTASLLTALDVPERFRLLHQSKWPLCSFAYAVTRESAQKILKTVAPEKEDISRNLKAYDVALLDGCRYKKHLNCYTIQPEFFHHMEGKSIIALEEETKDHHVFRPPVDIAGLEQLQYRQETSNIGCGFWSGEFYYDGQPEKLQWLQQEVGRKGKCLKPGRDLPG